MDEKQKQQEEQPPQQIQAPARGNVLRRRRLPNNGDCWCCWIAGNLLARVVIGFGGGSPCRWGSWGSRPRARWAGASQSSVSTAAASAASFLPPSWRSWRASSRYSLARSITRNIMILISTVFSYNHEQTRFTAFCRHRRSVVRCGRVSDVA